MQQKDYSAALNEIRDVTARFPGNASSYVLMGDIYAWMEDYRKAAESFETALKIDPANPTAKRGMEQLRNMLVKKN
jgi:cytochrome c-type biogenesis protein CcmH/NrfG